MSAMMNFGMAQQGNGELPPGVKRCPRCGELLFSDMSVCYGCLYDFERKPYRPPEGLDVSPLPPLTGNTPEATATLGKQEVRLEGTMPSERPQGASPHVEGQAAGKTVARSVEERVPVVAGRDIAVGLPKVTNAEQGTSAFVSARMDEAGSVRSEGMRVEKPARFRPSEASLADEAEGTRLVVDDGLEAAGTLVLEEPQHAIKVQTNDADFTVPVPQEGLVVGRGRECDIVLHSRAISRRHLRMTPAGPCVSVRDLGSTNPATLDGKPIRSTVNLRPGETLNLCGYQVTVAQCEGPAPPFG